MAVKLMPVAPVGPGAPAAPAEPSVQVEEQPKQPRKRRRAAVYDADGNEVLITLKCLKCNRMHPLSNFGLRKMADGAIRNQPWCRECRGASSPKKKKGEAPLEPGVEAALQASDAPQAPAPQVAAPTPAAPPQPSGPMQVVPLTAEQVLRALAPQLLQQMQQAQQQPAAPVEPQVEPELPAEDDGEPEAQ